MEATGKIIQILPIQSGEGRNGVWKKQEIILELDNTTPPKKLCIGLWGDKIIPDLAVGYILKVSFEIESKEYNNKWYTNLRAWKVEEVSEMKQQETVHEQEKGKREALFDASDKMPFDDEMPF